jgi:hypothetical protein
MKLLFLARFLVIAALLAACNLPMQFSVGPQAWIDSPLDASVLPLAPVVVISHSSDLGGIVNVELSVDNAVLLTSPNPNASQTLVTLQQPWNPAAPGTYHLRVRAQNSAGLWSGYAVALVVIKGNPPGPSLVASPTPTPAVAPTPTSTPGSTSTLTSEVLFGTPDLSSDHFYYHKNGCGPTQVTFTIQALNGNVADVLLFYHLRDQTTGEATDWNQGIGMQPGGNGSFSRTVMGDGIPGTKVPLGVSGRPQDYTLLYQFVAVDGGGASLGRSPVFSNLVLSYCSH